MSTEEKVASIFPNTETDDVFASKAIEDAKEQAILKAYKKENSQEQANLRTKIRRLKEKYGEDAVSDTGEVLIKPRKQVMQEEQLEAIEAEEVDSRYRPEISGGLAYLNGTTSVEIAKLMNDLGVNLDVQLTHNDTKNLLATLLTCNEHQLDALYSNKRIPLSIKTVIKALKNDSLIGRMDTVESLWNRLFGSDTFRIQTGQESSSIVPNTPVSRETYVLIRETLLGK